MPSWSASAKLSLTARSLSFGLLVLILLLCATACEPTGSAVSEMPPALVDACVGWFPAAPADPDTLPQEWNAVLEAQRLYGEQHRCPGSEINP